MRASPVARTGRRALVDQPGGRFPRMRSLTLQKDKRGSRGRDHTHPPRRRDLTHYAGVTASAGGPNTTPSPAVASWIDCRSSIDSLPHR